jgi:PPOX class probable F420-dependent enzyme
VTTKLPDDLLELLQGPSPCFLATTMPDGSPQLTETWVDTDGEHVLINTVRGHVKLRNIDRDPRVALNIVDPTEPARYFGLRGHAVGTTTHGGAENIESLAQKYTGRPYPWFSGRDEVRVIVTIAVDRVVHTPQWG